MRKGSPEFSMLLLILGREEVGPKGPTVGGLGPCWVGEGAAWLQWPGHLSSPLPGCLHRVNLWGKCGPLGARAGQLPRTKKALCVLPVWSHPLQPTAFSFSPSSLAGHWLAGRVAQLCPRGLCSTPSCLSGTAHAHGDFGGTAFEGKMGDWPRCQYINPPNRPPTPERLEWRGGISYNCHLAFDSWAAVSRDRHLLSLGLGTILLCLPV